MKTSKIELLQKTLETLEIVIEQKQNELYDLDLQIDNFEPDLHDHYDECLDDIYFEEVNQISFISLPSPSELLKEHDPIAYRCGYADFAGNFDFEELEEYRDLLEQKEEMENDIEDIKEQIEELEEDVEQLEEEVNENV